MKKSLLGMIAMLPLFTTGCNLFGGLSSPSNDAQYLDAARACLDQGNYDCAQKNYEALSNSYNDVKISEEGLTTLASQNIFSISDLVESLGTNLGSAASFSILAVAMEQRGITNGSYRTTIKQIYDNDAGINDIKLQAFSKFLTSLAMLNELLANAVGSDGQLTASDIVADPTTCKTSNGADTVACAAPSGTAVTYNSNDTASMTVAGNGTGNGAWDGTPTIQKLITAAVETSSEFSVFASGSTNQSLLDAIQKISHLNAGVATAAAEAAVRYGIVTALDL